MRQAAAVPVGSGAPSPGIPPPLEPEVAGEPTGLAQKKGLNSILG